MTMPEQLRRQTEAVAKMYETMNADAAQTETEVAGADGEASSQADGNREAAPVSAPNEQRQTDTTAENTFEQRYRTLQGMYNADTSRLRSENQQLNSRVTHMEQLLSSLSTAPAAISQTETSDKLVTSKDIEEYGDSIDVMRRVTKEEVSAANRRIAELEHMIRQMHTSVVPKVEQVAQRQAMSAEQSFWAELSAVVPQWRDVNADGAFHNWLLEIDPMTGLTRQSYLEDAQRNLDARRVANIFATWQGLSGQSVAQSPRPAPASQLERQVAPGRSRSSGAAVTDQPKTYAPEDIRKFFEDVRKGLYKGKEAERDRIERDIFAAQRENRIVNG
jgi:hypothetical protein